MQVLGHSIFSFLGLVFVSECKINGMVLLNKANHCLDAKKMMKNARFAMSTLQNALFRRGSTYNYADWIRLKDYLRKQFALVPRNLLCIEEIIRETSVICVYPI